MKLLLVISLPFEHLGLDVPLSSFSALFLAGILRQSSVFVPFQAKLSRLLACPARKPNAGIPALGVVAFWLHVSVSKCVVWTSFSLIQIHGALSVANNLRQSCGTEIGRSTGKLHVSSCVVAMPVDISDVVTHLR